MALCVYYIIDQWGEYIFVGVAPPLGDICLGPTDCQWMIPGSYNENWELPANGKR